MAARNAQVWFGADAATVALSARRTETRTAPLAARVSFRLSLCVTARIVGRPAVNLFPARLPFLRFSVLVLFSMFSWLSSCVFVTFVSSWLCL